MNDTIQEYPNKSLKEV